MSVALINPITRRELQETVTGLEDQDGTVFPLEKGVYQMVPGHNYTDSFGFQWKLFKSLQLDKHSKLDLTKDRFFAATGWNQEELKGQSILEAGCGAGRFTQVVLDNTQAELYSFDYSESVDANFENNGPNPRLHLFQADIYHMPFELNSFDKVFCFGVLQFTPDFKKALGCLAEVVKPGGEIVVDFFPVRGFWTKIHAKYILRPFTSKMDHNKLLRLIEKNVVWLISLSRFFDKIKIGGLLNRFLPVCDFKNTIPDGLSRDTFRHWVILDTFNMLSPRYDNPQAISTVCRWMKEFGLMNVIGEVKSYGKRNQVTVVKGVKPQNP